jgi:hypothetical protein
MSKGEKIVIERRSECTWVLVFPSMPKGDIVGKYLIDNECFSLMASTIVKLA